MNFDTICVYIKLLERVVRVDARLRPRRSDLQDKNCAVERKFVPSTNHDIAVERTSRTMAEIMRTNASCPRVKSFFGTPS